MSVRPPAFPVVPYHEAAICFHCARPLGDTMPADSGFPPGFGAFRKTCPACGLKTWYDVPAAPAERDGRR